jgi:hypothetical protein
MLMNERLLGLKERKPTIKFAKALNAAQCKFEKVIMDFEKRRASDDKALHLIERWPRFLRADFDSGETQKIDSGWCSSRRGRLGSLTQFSADFRTHRFSCSSIRGSTDLLWRKQGQGPGTAEREGEHIKHSEEYDRDGGVGYGCGE